MVGKQLLALAAIFLAAGAYAQKNLSLQEALRMGAEHYGSIKSKQFSLQASESLTKQAKKEYLPNLVVSAQQVYGTINGQNGPAYGFGGFGVSSSGLPLAEQNWNAAFGALYLANVNWEFFSFGKVKGRIKVAEAAENISEEDLSQEQFQHQIRVASAYLNVLATQRLENAQAKNLERASVFQRSVRARARSGLIAGVDSSLANAEVSNAKIALIRAKDAVQQEVQRLAVLIGSDLAAANLDSSYVIRIPKTSDSTGTTAQHPVLRFYRSRVDYSLSQSRLAQKLALPSLNFVGVLQKRGSGFEAAYVQDQTAFTHSYIDGISPTRTNYLLGVGLTWNITNVTRNNSFAKAANYSAQAAQSEYALAEDQLKKQQISADQKLANALAIFNEAPIQVFSATNAYEQKNALYRNGLSTIVDVTQTLYTLNRAEADRDLAYINVWQAVLMKAAATGDLSIFTNELQ